MDEYTAFLAGKRPSVAPSGFDVSADALNPHLWDWQRDCVRWALGLGKACLFLSTGLGKTRCQVEWAHHVCRHTGGNVLILAPLAVALQTVREAASIGIDVRYCRQQADVQPGITITNYDMLHAFDPSTFVGVVLDESSLIKSSDGATRVLIQEAFAATPYKLACTATPAPNDYIELGTHAAFVGAMTQQEMLSMFFVHDGGSTQDWRLKGHARADFWRWVASWAMMIRLPGDLGYDNTGYILPELRTHEHLIAADDSWVAEDGYLFAPGALSLTQSRRARKAGVGARVEACADLVSITPGQWIVWAGLNAEGDALEKAIPGAVQVSGADSLAHKEQTIAAFLDGTVRVLVSKSSIFGFGLNLQCCHQMAFVGVDYSYERYYQAIRRCWRFGQEMPVDVHVFCTESEYGVLAALAAKEQAADAMAAEMVEHMHDTLLANIKQATRRETTPYNPTVLMRLPGWLRGEDAA